jgi:hypothetical protein
MKDDDGETDFVEKLGFRGCLLPTTAEELAQLLRQSDGKVISHTWGTPEGGLFWRRCPWVVPMICDMRGIDLSAAARKVFNEMKPEAI